MRYLVVLPFHDYLKRNSDINPSNTVYPVYPYLVYTHSVILVI